MKDKNRKAMWARLKKVSRLRFPAELSEVGRGESRYIFYDSFGRQYYAKTEKQARERVAFARKNKIAGFESGKKIKLVKFQ
jgi:hypothetical protein